MAHAYPDFLIVGMMKAGTTSLHHHLADHRGVVEPLEKELHHFTSDFGPRVPQAAWGLEYGEKLGLEGCQPRAGMLTGEASPSYIAVPERIHAFNPNCKIIIALRDPVSRAVSQLRQYHSHDFKTVKGGFARQFAEAEDISGLNAVVDSTYLPRLKRWFAIFPHDQIALVSFEAFTREPQLVMNRLFRWLGLDVKPIREEFRGAKTDVHYDESVIRSRLEQHFAPLRGLLAAEMAEKNLFLVPNDLSEFNNY
ncbi:sulfotransferase [Aliiroseovarius sp.]|uniref:sulfotransferase family protein n=1 Tax=Aliiroseovarius sp. TaxID=1872442 RepID=UPI002617E161|nr:sulfotransferase [Aliiroseovarius sp.]